MQKLARTIDYWSKAISHVRGTRRCGPFWSRHYMDLYLGKRMARRVRCCVKGMAHVLGVVPLIACDRETLACVKP